MLELDGTLLVAIISFIIFAFIMNEVLYKPIIKILEERKAFIDNNARKEKELLDEVQKISDQKQSELAQARAKATAYVAEGSEKYKQQQKNETDEFAKLQKEKAEDEKLKLKQEAELSEKELTKGVQEISSIISDKLLGGKNV